MSYWTQDVPGSGGILTADPSDFIVDEILAYAPGGVGPHLYLHVEKTGANTHDVVRHLATAYGQKDRDIGVAGLKDRHAITRQWFSVPTTEGPERFGAEGETSSFRVLDASRHMNKIKRGHQRGNRFAITIRDVNAAGVAAATASLEALRSSGVPNAFGPQRFGRDGDNAERCLGMIRGDTRRPRNRRTWSLLLSALQSAVFNEVLSLRMRDGLLATALAGDVMKKHDSGGLFDVEDPAVEQPRVDALEISPTAALPGPKARAAKGAALELELAALTKIGLTDADVAQLDVGTRRALRYPLDPTAVITPVGEDAYRLEVELPSGSYATVLLGELMKPSGGIVERAH